MPTENLEKQSKKVVENLKKELASLQIWKASPSILDSIEIFIPHWGLKQKLNQLANVSVIDNQTLKVQPRDKSIISYIEKSIQESGIGLNPLNHWDHILIKIPPLTGERREELKKYIKKIWEDYKISIRNIRQQFLKDIKAQYENKEISEDEKNNLNKEIDEITKKYTWIIEEKILNKGNEIMEIK